jgi:hypothetical protein
LSVTEQTVSTEHHALGLLTAVEVKLLECLELELASQLDYVSGLGFE